MTGATTDGWKIVPAALSTALTSASTHATGVSTAANRLVGEVLEPVGTYGGFDGIVADALMNFLQEQGDGRLTRMLVTMESAMSSTHRAATAYFDGDAEMAVQTAQNATSDANTAYQSAVEQTQQARAQQAAAAARAEREASQKFGGFDGAGGSF